MSRTSITLGKIVIGVVAAHLSGCALFGKPPPRSAFGEAKNCPFYFSSDKSALKILGRLPLVVQVDTGFVSVVVLSPYGTRLSAMVLESDGINIVGEQVVSSPPELFYALSDLVNGGDSPQQGSDFSVARAGPCNQ